MSIYKLKKYIILIFAICFSLNEVYALENNFFSVEKLEIIQIDMNDEERYISAEDNFSHILNINLSGYKKLYSVQVSIYYDMSAKKYKNLVNEEYETLDKIKVYNNDKYIVDVEFSEASELLGEIDIRDYLNRVKSQYIISQITGNSYKGKWDLQEKNEIVSGNSKFVITDFNIEFDKTINDFCIIGFYGYFLTR